MTTVLVLKTLWAKLTQGGTDIVVTSTHGDITVTIPAECFVGSSSLTIKTPFGSVKVSPKELGGAKDIYEYFTISVHSKKNNLKFEIRKDGMSIPYAGTQIPIFVTINYDKLPTESDVEIVGVQVSGSINKVLPMSAYRNSVLEIATFQVGEYKGMYNSKGFTDIANEILNESIRHASARNLFSGVGNQQFAPDKEITLEEMVGMLVNYLHKKGIVLDKTNYKTIGNPQNISHWAIQAVEYLHAAGVLNGNEIAINPQVAVLRSSGAKTFRDSVKATGTFQWLFI